MAQRDVRQRYAGASLGTWWAVVNPLVFVGAYTLLFTVIFRARLTPDAPPSAYAMYVVSGLLPWVAFTEVATRATQTVAEHRGLIKYTMFPAELLPLTGLYGALISQGVGLMLLMIFGVVRNHSISLDLLWIVPCLFLEIAFLAGVAWLLAAIGAVLRDIKEVIPITLATGMFFTPIFYDSSTLPALIRTIVELNPLSVLLMCFRAAMIGLPMNLPQLAWFSVFSIALCPLGFVAFERVRGEIADTL
jgi:lipopolysaccharide transport system permease protein